MNDPEARFTEMIALLKGHDFRLTPQWVEFVRLIAVSDGHPSAAQLYTKIKEIFPTMSHVTVYKTLALLKEMNQVLLPDSAPANQFLRPVPGLPAKRTMFFA